MTSQEHGPDAGAQHANAADTPIHDAPVETPETIQSFDGLGLSEKVLAAVKASGYTTPTPIQAQAIPPALTGRDILGIAQTGTGKTAAFVLPMLSRLESGRARARMPRTLILEPTRELAAQVEESFVKYGANHKLNVALLIGGVSFADQETKITRGADVLIATPGRLLDFSERGKLLLTGIDILVIDEADRMLDMGFIPDIERICKLVPFTRQTLFFSATMPPEITRLTEQFLHNPVRIEVARAATTASTITQSLVASHGGGAKRETLRRLIRESRAADAFKNAIIFCNRKRDVAILHKSLEKHGFSVGALHGDMDQRARMLSLDAFKTGAVDLLVCSDVAARGLDIPDVSHVFNFDLPTHAEDYVHRIGRTGRAGKKGAALSIVTRADTKYLAEIEKVIVKSVDWDQGITLDKLPPDESGGEDERPRGRGDRGARGASQDRPSRLRSGGEDQSGAQASRRSRNGSRRPHSDSSDEAPTAATPQRSRRNGGASRPNVIDDDAAITLAPPPRREATPRRDATPDTLRRNQAVPGSRRSATSAASPSETVVPAEDVAPIAPRRQPTRARAPETASPANPARGRNREGDDRPVVGMGDHVPMFMQRPVRVKPSREEAES